MELGRSQRFLYTLSAVCGCSFGIEPYHIWKNEKDRGAGDVKDGVPFQPNCEEQKKYLKPLWRDIQISNALQDM